MPRWTMGQLRPTFRSLPKIRVTARKMGGPTDGRALGFQVFSDQACARGLLSRALSIFHF